MLCIIGCWLFAGVISNFLYFRNIKNVKHFSKLIIDGPSKKDIEAIVILMLAGKLGLVIVFMVSVFKFVFEGYSKRLD